MVQVSLAVALACTASLIWTCGAGVPARPKDASNSEAINEDDKTFVVEGTDVFEKLPNGTLVAIAIFPDIVWGKRHNKFEINTPSEYKRTGDLLVSTVTYNVLGPTMSIGRKLDIEARINDLTTKLNNLRKQLEERISQEGETPVKLKLKHLLLGIELEDTKLQVQRNTIPKFFGATPWSESMDHFDRDLNKLTFEIQFYLIKESEPYISSGNKEESNQEEKTFFFKGTEAFVRLTDKTFVPMSTHVHDVWMDSLKDQLAAEYKQTSLTDRERKHINGRINDLFQNLLNHHNELAKSAISNSQPTQLSILELAYMFEYSKITAYTDQISQTYIASPNMPFEEDSFEKVLDIMEEEVNVLIDKTKPFLQINCTSENSNCKDYQKSTTALPTIQSHSVSEENGQDDKMFFFEGKRAIVRLTKDRYAFMNLANYEEWYDLLKKQLESEFSNKTVTLERKKHLQARMEDLLVSFTILESQLIGISVPSDQKRPLLKIVTWYEYSKIIAYNEHIKELKIATPPSIPEEDNFDKDLDIMKQEIEYLMKESKLPVAYGTYMSVMP